METAGSQADIHASRSMRHFRLFADFSRIAAIQPNVLAPTNVNGPLPPLATTSKCCGAARRSGFSCRARHFVGSNVGVRNLLHNCAERIHIVNPSW